MIASLKQAVEIFTPKLQAEGVGAQVMRIIGNL